jgi:hypothetical protein
MLNSPSPLGRTEASFSQAATSMSTTSRRLSSPPTALRFHSDLILAIDVSLTPCPPIPTNLHPSPHFQIARSLLKSYPSHLMIMNLDHRLLPTWVNLQCQSQVRCDEMSTSRPLTKFIAFWKVLPHEHRLLFPRKRVDPRPFFILKRSDYL